MIHHVPREQKNPFPNAPPPGAVLAAAVTASLASVHHNKEIFRQEKVNRLNDIQNMVQNSHKLSAQTRQSAFLVLVGGDEVVFNDEEERQHIPNLRRLSNNSDSSSSSPSSLPTIVEVNEDLVDIQLVTQNSEAHEENGDIDVKEEQQTTRPKKRFKPQTSKLPKENMIQNDAIQRAMERQKAKQRFLGFFFSY